ncbi:MAG: hypothetical protein RR623_00030 [Bacilli bacterium]
MVGIVNKPDINYGIWASNGDVAVPSSEKVEIGHIVEKPKKEIVNWIENRQDQFMAYLNQVGVSEWDSKTTYKANISFVNRSGTVYKAKSQNIDKDPTLNQDIWEISWATYSDFYNLSNRVENIETVDEYLDFYVSKANPEFTVETKGIGYGNADLTSSFNFNNGNPSVKKDDEIIAEFSGSKSGKDVVTYEDLQELLKIKVGDLYTTTVNEDPSVRLGYGAWVRFAEGRTLVGFSGSVSNDIPEWVKTKGSEFGEYTHLQTLDELVKHNHKVGQLGYKHSFPESWDIIGASDGISNDGIIDQLAYRGSTETGGSKPFNVVQPSKVVFIWLRTS